jgi:hypothetical protein
MNFSRLSHRGTETTEENLLNKSKRTKPQITQIKKYVFARRETTDAKRRWSQSDINNQSRLPRLRLATTISID